MPAACANAFIPHTLHYHLLLHYYLLLLCICCTDIGASSALNVVGAVKCAQLLGPGHTVATVLCDGAARYQSRLFSKQWLLSKELYDNVPEDCRHLITLE
jgi:hypothetical protein